MQQNYKNNTETFSLPQLAGKGRKYIKPGIADRGNGHITALTRYNKFQCSALSDFAPKDKTGREYFKAVIQTSLLYRMAPYSTRNLQIKR